MKKMPKRKIQTYSIFAAAIGILIVAYLSRALLPLESFLMRGLNPLLGGMYSIGNKVNSGYARQVDKRDLQKINDELSARVSRLTVDNSRLRVLEEENKILRETLKFINENKYDYVVSNIVSRGEAGGMVQTLTIDKGSRDGLVSGLAAVNSQGVVVGKLAEVKDNLSRIELTTSNKCKMAATIQNSNKTTGITRGELGLTVKMDFIPQIETIKKDDIVVTSGLEKNIPRGLVIGRITEVVKENNELWQSTTIEPLINSNDIVIVSVLLP